MLFSPIKPGTLQKCRLPYDQKQKVLLEKDIEPINILIENVTLILIEIAETPCSDSAKFQAMESVLMVTSNCFEEISQTVDFEALRQTNARFQKMKSKFRRRYSAF